MLLVDGQGVIVSANTAAGLFYGVQTLRQLVYPSGDGYRVRAVAVRDAPAMRYRWQQDDWSRGPIPTLEYAKKQVRILSEYKINGYSIYAEKPIPVEVASGDQPVRRHDHPGGDRRTDRLRRTLPRRDHPAATDLRASALCVAAGALRRSRRKRGSQILSPTEPGAYDFIGDYLGEIVPMFTSEFIHIGCDETFELGRGKAKSRWPGRRTPTFTWDI